MCIFTQVGLLPFQMAFHGSKMGVILTTYKSRDDPPSKVRPGQAVSFRGRISPLITQLWSATAQSFTAINKNINGDKKVYHSFKRAQTNINPLTLVD